MSGMEQTIRVAGIIADVMTILGVGGLLTYGAATRDKNLLGRTIFKLVVFTFRLAIVLAVGAIMYPFYFLVYEVFLGMLGGYSTSEAMYWQAGQAPRYIAAYSASALFFLPALVIFAMSVFTASLYYPKLFLKTISGGYIDFQLDIYQQHLVLEIIEATYGSEAHNIDVTNILRSLVESGKLRVFASNRLAGDPHPGVVKMLNVKWRADGPEKQTNVEENKLLEIPSLK